MIDIFSGFGFVLIGLFFAIVGGLGLKTFFATFTDNESQKNEDIFVSIIPNALFLSAFILGIANMLHGVQVIAGVA